MYGMRLHRGMKLVEHRIRVLLKARRDAALSMPMSSYSWGRRRRRRRKDASDLLWVFFCHSVLDQRRSSAARQRDSIE